MDGTGIEGATAREVVVVIASPELGTGTPWGSSRRVIGAVPWGARSG